MRVVADSHTIVWHLRGSPQLSANAASALMDAEATDAVVVSVATLIDLWYVTQTTEKLTTTHLDEVRDTAMSSPVLVLQPIDVAVTDATATIPRDLLADPWDRLIVGTAKALAAPLVTRDRAIQESGLVPTIW